MTCILQVSAVPIEITPSKISINFYPYETIQQNITIKTSGNYIVYFISNNENISISPNETNVYGEKTITLNLTFNTEHYQNNLTFDILASTEYEEVGKSGDAQYEGHGGGGGGGSSNVIIINNTNKTKDIIPIIKYINYSNNDNKTNQYNQTKTDEVKSNKNLWIGISLLVVAFGTIIFIVWIIKKD